jgi:serine/threonine protein kinase
MTWLSDASLAHLREVADWPDLSGTRYEALERIGRGGMGAVYLARDRELDRHVALKVLDAPRPTPEDEARLLREARILARLEHPGIVPVHDLGSLPDGRLFYTMKWVRGSRLDEHAQRNAPLVELLHLFQRICETVGFAHARGVIHRDLKPENVMVGSFGEVLVLDWGVAKLLQPAEAGRNVSAEPVVTTSTGASPDGGGSSSGGSACAGSATSVGAPLGPAAPATVGGTVLGTPGYMAPEQSRGEVDRVDVRADVYALGAMLDFLLRRSSGKEDAPPPADSRSDRGGGRGFPRQLAAIRAKALAERPEERYASVLDLSADVSRFLAGVPVAAYPETLVDRAARLSRKYRTPILLVLAYLVMRLLLLAFG